MALHNTGMILDVETLIVSRLYKHLGEQKSTSYIKSPTPIIGIRFDFWKARRGEAIIICVGRQEAVMLEAKGF
ncbi:MAG: hypothetical protein AAFW70_14670 [Cyanobacteria bacterium J06635_10]